MVDKIVNCNICGNIDVVTPRSICKNTKRDNQMICVIEDMSDLWTFERIGFYRGMYHVLGGTLSAINGIGVDELSINKVLDVFCRINHAGIILIESDRILTRSSSVSIPKSFLSTKLT